MATVHNATIAHCTLLLVSNVPVHFADNNSTMHFIRRLVLLLSDGYSHVSSVEMNRDYRYLKDSQNMQGWCGILIFDKYTYLLSGLILILILI